MWWFVNAKQVQNVLIANTDVVLCFLYSVGTLLSLFNVVLSFVCSITFTHTCIHKYTHTHTHTSYLTHTLSLSCTHTHFAFQQCQGPT